MNKTICFIIILDMISCLFLGVQAKRKKIVKAVSVEPKGINCEPLDVAMCKGMGYDLTSFPTTRLERQSEATVELQQFYSLIEAKCSEVLQEFLCYAYAPECTKSQKAIYPCRSMCRKVKRECIVVLRAFGYTWPEMLSCDNFNTTDCKDVDSEEKSITCEPLNIDMCENVGYNVTSFPTTRHSDQRDAALELQQYYPLIQIKCSEVLADFLCYTYAPECTESQEAIYPCRSMCEEAKRGCIEIMTRFGFSWPDILSCDNFNTTNCKDIELQQKNCKDLEVPICASYGYNTTADQTVPHFQRNYRDDVISWMDEIVNYISVECREALERFVCLAHFPPCETSRRKPCRSSCEEVISVCSPPEIPTMKWLIECQQYPTESYRPYDGADRCISSDEDVVQMDVHRKRLLKTKRLARRAKTDVDMASKIIDRLGSYVEQIVENGELETLDPIKAITFNGLRSSISGLRNNANFMSTFLNFIED